MNARSGSIPALQSLEIQAGYQVSDSNAQAGRAGPAFLRSPFRPEAPFKPRFAGPHTPSAAPVEKVGLGIMGSLASPFNRIASFSATVRIGSCAKLGRFPPNLRNRGCLMKRHTHPILRGVRATRCAAAHENSD